MVVVVGVVRVVAIWKVWVMEKGGREGAKEGCGYGGCVGIMRGGERKKGRFCVHGGGGVVWGRSL